MTWLVGPSGWLDELAASGVVVSPSRVWRTLVRHRPNTRQLRYALLKVHRHGVPPVAERRSIYVGELQASEPGDLVQMDCFQVGSFKDTRLGGGKAQRRMIWRYTAIDVASSYT